MAGSFESASRLLHDQLGVVSFKPYENLFLSLYSSSRTVANHLANLPPHFTHPLRNWKEATVKTGLPATGINLNELVSKLQVRFVCALFKSLTFMQSVYVTQILRALTGLLSVNYRR